MSGDAEPHMWKYWRDKYGCEIALADYYPSLLASDPELQLALFQIKAAQGFIEQRMASLPQD